MGNLQCSNPQLIQADSEKTIVYLAAGNASLEVENYEGAVSYFEQALVLQRKLFHRNDISIVNTCIKLAYTYNVLSNNEKALFYFQKALGKSQRSSFNEKIPYLYYEIGNIYRTTKQYTQALDSYEQGFYKAKSLFGKEHILVGTIAFELAKVCMKFEMFDEAFDYLVETCHVCIKYYGENHPIVSDCFVLMGKVHKRQGNVKESIVFYQTAAKLLEKNSTEDFQDLAAVYNHLASLLKQEKRYQDALGYLKKCVPLEINYYGIDDPRVEATMNTVKQVAKMTSEDTTEVMEYFDSFFLVSEKPRKKNSISETILTSSTESFSDEKDKNHFDDILDSVNEVQCV